MTIEMNDANSQINDANSQMSEMISQTNSKKRSRTNASREQTREIVFVWVHWFDSYESEEKAFADARSACAFIADECNRICEEGQVEIEASIFSDINTALRNCWYDKLSGLVNQTPLREYVSFDVQKIKVEEIDEEQVLLSSRFVRRDIDSSESC